MALAERTAVTALDHVDAFDAQQHKGFDLIVAACKRPVVSPARWRALVECQETVTLVQLLGVWCEGEGRTGKALERFVRVFWHAWPEWLDRWLDRSDEAPPNTLFSGPVAIDSPDRELLSALIATLEGDGVFAFGVTNTQATKPAIILWDGAQLRGAEADRLATVCRRADAIRAPVVAMLDFPRPETVAAARALGVTTVVGKPIDRNALLRTMRSALDQREEAVAPDQIELPPFELFAEEFGEGDLTTPSRLVDRPDADAPDGEACVGEPPVGGRFVGAVAPG